MQELYRDIVILLGGTSVIILAIITYLGNVFLKRLQSNWKHENDLQVTSIKAELDKSQSLIIQLASTYSSGHQVAQSKKIEAVETLWKNILKLKDQSKHVSIIYNLLTDEEILKPKNEKVLQIFNKLNIELYTNQSVKIIDEVQQSRPLIGDELWNLFSMYNTFCGRSLFLLSNQFGNKSPKLWNQDKATLNTLKTVLEEEEYNFIITQKHKSFDSVIITLEQKILNKCNSILTGQEVMDNTLNQVNKLNKILNVKTN
jgi:hypothetical protein